jgi:cobalt-zinc-cadmium efflux system outer membrane protein
MANREGSRWPAVALTLLLAAGCHFPVQDEIDRVVCDLAARPRDLSAPGVSTLAVPLPSPQPLSPTGGEGSASSAACGFASSVLQEERKEPTHLKIPTELLPGGPVPPLRLPSVREKEKRDKAIDELYPELPPLGPDLQLEPGPEGKPLTLSALQRLALSNSPVIRQAAAEVQARRGEAIQAGLPPNPTIGYQSDTAATNGTPGYQGGFIEQTIKTGNKLQLARAVAAVELRKAELALRRAEADLLTRVRSAYFSVLVAREAVRIHKALAMLADQAYRLQVVQVRQGVFAAPYEPAYLRVLAMEARGQLLAARNRHARAWKQLAAALGLPGMPPTQLAGGIDLPLPVYEYAAILAHVLSRHTDVGRADAEILRARYALGVEQAKLIPDVTFHLSVLKDFTAPPDIINHSVTVGIPLPLWNRNQGKIMAAQADLVGASERPHAVRAALTRQVAEAFERYASGRALLRYYRDSILPDQVRVYRGVYDRYRTEPADATHQPPNLGDVIVAQQGLATALTSYLNALGELWQAVADLGGLLQTDDLFLVGDERVPGEPIPLLLPLLPCSHPCSELADGYQHPPDGRWDTAPVPEASAMENRAGSVSDGKAIPDGGDEVLPPPRKAQPEGDPR